MNAVEIEAAISDLALQPFNTSEFPFAFLAAFGNKDTTLKRLRANNNNPSDIFGGVLQRNNIHMAVCAEGAVGQTLNMLRSSPATTKNKVKFVLATDGSTLEAEELVSGETVACDYVDFPNHFGFFLPLAGISTVKEIKDNPIDVRATGRLNKLYVELLQEDPEWASEDRRPDMNHFMARLVFCFFAEDTDIFEGQGLFTHTVERMSERDGSNTAEVVQTIFRAMNIKVEDRDSAIPRLPHWASTFPYVNGGLFSGTTDVPRFTRMARTYLLHAGNLNWRKINPDIFGSMIQAVADDDERGALGMHYTSVPNILKVLNPLFLDELRGQLDDAGDNERKLSNLRKRIARIRVFDPACGSGNFLVIAYKQMREIEAEINRRRGEPHFGTQIPLTNFRGIELRNFPAEIARLALIIAEFQCDVLYRGQKDALAEFLPLDSQNWIVCGNALRLDWLSICPSTGTGVKVTSDDLFGTPLDQSEIDFENEGGETFICGNPPYKGSRFQDDAQKEDVKFIASKLVKGWRSLDYVSGWLIKAHQYQVAVPSDFSFVTTSSICEGLSVSLLWPLVLEGARISFAHRPFRWSNLASKNAGVTVVVVGVSNRKTEYRPVIYEGGLAKSARQINAYLLNADPVIVEKSNQPISELPTMVMGAMPRDGGHLLLSVDERKELIGAHPQAEAFVRRYLGSAELTSGAIRYCLWIEDKRAQAAREIPAIRERFELVTKMRAESKLDSTRQFKDSPHRFVYVAGQSQHLTIGISAISSERREYLPVDLLPSAAIASNKLFALYDAPIWTLSLVCSKMHVAWIGTVCGKMRTDYSYSNTLGWNTFPVPIMTEQNKNDLSRCAEEILLARESHFPATIADLYDPDTMPADLRRAHEKNDEVLERIYIGRRFRNDTERLEKLFELYTKMTSAPAKARAAAKKTKARNPS